MSVDTTNGGAELEVVKGVKGGVVCAREGTAKAAGEAWFLETAVGRPAV